MLPRLSPSVLLYHLQVFEYLQSRMIDGTVPEVNDTASSNQIIVSKTVADRLKLHTGDKVLTYFIDDAILIGVSRVRILHGTGSGILRTLIRQYLNTVPSVATPWNTSERFSKVPPNTSPMA